MTVRVTTADGWPFPVSKVIDAQRGGYTENGIDNYTGHIYVLYEDDFGTTVSLAVFNYEWLIEG